MNPGADNPMAFTRKRGVHVNENSFKYLLLFFCVIVFNTACENNPSDNNFQQEEFLISANLQEETARFYGDDSPQALFNDFIEMAKKVESMNSAELDSLENFEILKLGQPIQKVVNGTTYFEKEALNEALYYLRRLTDRYKSLSTGDIHFLNLRVEGILNGNENADTDNIQFLPAKKLRDILKNWTSDAAENNSCEELFNRIDDHVLMSAGENLNIANYACPDHSAFVLRSGTYLSQSVTKSKDGNKWVGLKDVILDGEHKIFRAFDGGFHQNTIASLEIRNYYLHGILSLSGPSDVTVNRVTFRDIAPDSSGQDFGAIKLDNATNVMVSESHFENVASAVRFRFSHGPLRVIDNTALNPGRNFFQCDKCRGPGIRINRNSLERTGPYGNTALEDWINIYQSRGAENDWIQVNYNRARGHSLSGSGSFIILGDDDGSYQEAIGNIGVNPGQVGIGIAGGHHIKVESNKMYSAEWDSSNVAFYSANYSLGESCGNHTFFRESSKPNRANWICGDSVHCKAPALNYAWTDGRCGISLDEIRKNITPDSSMGPEIWDEW